MFREFSFWVEGFVGAYLVQGLSKRRVQGVEGAGFRT